MKLIVAGSTGLLGTELIRQAASHRAITQIIALARRETPLPSDIGPGGSKVRSVACEDFENYADEVKKELSGADACIWTIGITPGKLKALTWAETCKISRDYTTYAIETMANLPREHEKPFRFLYVSAHFAPRDPAKKKFLLGDYGLLRGETESRVLAYAEQSKESVRSCVVKPGLIDAPERSGPVAKVMMTVLRTVIGLPKIQLRDMAAALLDQVVNGFEKDTLGNGDMIRIGQKALAG